MSGYRALVSCGISLWLICSLAACAPRAASLSARPASAEGKAAATSVPAQATLTPTPSLSYMPVISVAPATHYTYRVVNAYPHDRGAFTQGLVIEDGVLYEGTGLYGRSSLRKVDLDSGEVLQFRPLPEDYFGEGITVIGDRIYQLTWLSNIGFVYHRDSFELLKSFAYPTEGWGLTHDGQHLIMSDGTSRLFFLDPETLSEVRRIQVRDGGNPVVRLNELEYIDGTVYANIWQTDRIVMIDPESGRVTGHIDLSGLLSEEDRSQPVDVLNGIAYDREQGRLYVTGKLWPRLFQIELVPQG